MPGFIRALAIIHLFVFALLVLKPELQELLAFDWAKIQAGEAWRVVSFYALPPVHPGRGLSSYLFMGLTIYVAILISDQLEHAWGVFRTTIFSYGTILCQVFSLTAICAFLTPISAAWGTSLFYQAAFFAFATIFPSYQFRLLFGLRVNAWILALIAAAFGAASALAEPVYLLYALGTLIPYSVWGGPVLLGRLQNRATTQIRRAKFNSKIESAEQGSFHECASCGATELSHPERSFRVTSDDTELCSLCLNQTDPPNTQ